jgi:aromatic-amino-acid transaminase
VTSHRIASVQAIGGSGALKLAADLVHRYFPQSEVWISQPTWDNHRAIFEAAGVKVNEYPYYDRENNRIRFDELLACIQTLPARSVVLMHPCCHNPTGMDLSHEQWQQLITVFKQNNLIAYLDMAYQGFGQGIEEDAWTVRAFAAAGLSCFVGSSFSKSFSWYGERAGALHVVCANAKEADCVLGQLKAIVRQIYSSPPVHGAARSDSAHPLGAGCQPHACAYPGNAPGAAKNHQCQSTGAQF